MGYNFSKVVMWQVYVWWSCGQVFYRFSNNNKVNFVSLDGGFVWAFGGEVVTV